MSLKGMFNWADVRGRHVGEFAFLMHRLSGLVILLYLYVHLYVLSNLLNGGTSYGKFLSTVASPPFIALDILLFLVIFYHGANGVRLVINEFGVGTKKHKQIFWISMAIAAIGWIVLSYIVVIDFLGGA